MRLETSDSPHGEVYCSLRSRSSKVATAGHTPDTGNVSRSGYCKTASSNITTIEGGSNAASREHNYGDP